MILEFDNQFTVRRINLNTFQFPEPKVKSWTNLFGDGSESTVTVEAETPDGARITLARTTTARDNAHYTRQDAKSAVEAWMEDNKGNWLKEISRAAAYVHDHNVQQLAEYKEAIIKSEDQLSMVTMMTATHEAVKDAK